MSMVRSWSVLVPLLLVGVAGCGGAPSLKLKDPVSAKGTVTLDGKPLAKALIYFIPDGLKVKGPGSTAITDDSGNYTLTTMISDKLTPGAVPGNYRVSVSSLIGPTGEPIIPDGKTPPAMLAAREALPTRYSDVLTTELKATVPEGGGTFDFKVFSK